MGRIVRDWLAADERAPRPAMAIGDIHAIKTLVAAGMGASILPYNAMRSAEQRGDVVARPLAPALFYSLGLVQRRDKPADPAFAATRAALLALNVAPPRGGALGEAKLRQ